MIVFEHTFVVRAPLSQVAAFHRDTLALRRLTPPPIRVQFHRVDPLAEGAVADFTLWFGSFPVRWTAVHDQVDLGHRFRDTQVRGPLQSWQHEHYFVAAGAAQTRVRDRVTYAHYAGWRGWLTRLLFGRLALRLLFAYRAWAVRRALR